MQRFFDVTRILDEMITFMSALVRLFLFCPARSVLKSECSVVPLVDTEDGIMSAISNSVFVSVSDFFFARFFFFFPFSENCKTRDEIMSDVISNLK